MINLMSSRIVAVASLISRSFAESTKRICDNRSGLSSLMGYELRIGTDSGVPCIIGSHSKVQATW